MRNIDLIPLGVIFTNLLLVASAPSQNVTQCFTESDLYELRNILHGYNEQFEHLHSLTNQQRANFTATNQMPAKSDGTKIPTNKEDGRLLETWLDLFQLNVKINDLFTNYTHWLKGSTDSDVILNKDGEPSNVGPYFDKTNSVIFKMWLIMQDLQQNISKLEDVQRNKAPKDSNLERQLSELANEVTELSNKVETLKESKLSNKYESNFNDISEKNNNNGIGNHKAPGIAITTNDLHLNSLQGQIGQLNSTVTSLVGQLSTMMEEISVIKMSTFNNGPVTLHSSYEKITNETCNGNRRHQVGSSCYYIPKLFDSEKMYTWWDARYFCQRPDILGPDADLVVIETTHEMAALRNMITNHFGGIEGMWLGATDIDHEGSWIWAPTGAPLSTAAPYWAEPPQHDSSSNCAAMEEGFEWIAEPCYYERVPLCELPL